MKELPPRSKETESDLTKEDELELVGRLLRQSERMNRVAADWLSARSGLDVDSAYRVMLKMNQAWVAASLGLLGIPDRRLTEALVKQRESDL
jgi:hypothetical protein